MSSRHNFLDADNSIMERNLRFVTNDLEDNLNQYFGGSGSRGHNPAISAPPRDYKVVQPKPVKYTGGCRSSIRSYDLEEIREFPRQIGLEHHDVAINTNFDVKYYRVNHQELRDKGLAPKQIDHRVVSEIKSDNYKRDNGGEVMGEDENYYRRRDVIDEASPSPARIYNIQREQDCERFDDIIPPPPRKIKWNSESELNTHHGGRSSPFRRRNEDREKSAVCSYPNTSLRPSTRDSERNTRKFSRSPRRFNYTQEKEGRYSRSSIRNDYKSCNTATTHFPAKDRERNETHPSRSSSRHTRSPLENDNRSYQPTRFRLQAESGNNATRSLQSPPRHLSYIQETERNYKRRYSRSHSRSPLRNEYKYHQATTSSSASDSKRNAPRSSRSPSRHSDFMRGTERNDRNRHPPSVLRNDNRSSSPSDRDWNNFESLSSPTQKILQISNVTETPPVWLTKRESDNRRKLQSETAAKKRQPIIHEAIREERRIEKSTLPKTMEKLKAFSKKAAYRNVMKKGMSKFLESPTNKAIFLTKPKEGYLKGNPRQYWTIWWSSLKYIETAIPVIDRDDIAVKPVIKFLFEPGGITYANRKRILLEMGVNTSKQIFENINEENYATWDMFRLMQFLKHLRDVKFQMGLAAFELHRVKRGLKPWRKNKRKLALLHQALICMWHFPMRGYKHVSGEEKIRLIQNHPVLGNKAFHYLVSESIQILKKLTTDDWPEFEKYYESLDVDEFDKSVFVFLEQKHF